MIFILSIKQNITRGTMSAVIQLRFSSPQCIVNILIVQLNNAHNGLCLGQAMFKIISCIRIEAFQRHI
jgi:hypothetical protein